MQLNIRTDPAFVRELDDLVRKAGLRTRTAAIKKAVHAMLEQTRTRRPKYDFHRAIGFAGKLKSTARFQSDDDLYRDGMP